MKIRIKCLTFYLSWITYLFNYIIFEQSQFQDLITNDSISRWVKIIDIFLLLVTIFLQKSIRKKTFILTGIIAFIFLLSFLTGDSWTVLFWGLFSLAAINNIDYKQFLKLDIIIRSILYLFVFICVILGVLKNESVIVFGNEKVTLGYIHYNMFGMNMGVLITEIIAILRDRRKSKIKMYTLVFVICVFQMFVGVGRTGLYGSIIIIIASLLLENKIVLNFVKNHKTIFSLWAIVCALSSYIVSYFYDSGNKLMLFLNNISSTRIAFSKRFLTEYNLSIFGHQLYINNDTERGVYSALDMGYIRIGLEYGLIILLILLITFYLLQKVSLENNNIGLYLSLMYFSITLLVASSVMNIANNWTLIFTLQILLGRPSILTKQNLNYNEKEVNTIENRTLYSL